MIGLAYSLATRHGVVGTATAAPIFWADMTARKREELRMKFGGKCAYCGIDLPEKGWHADHVEPIYRKTKWETNPDTGYRRLVQTGECYHPERDTEDNLFPCCRGCNIHKGPLTLESWRKNLEDLTGILSRGYPTYRHAVRFGQILENRVPIVFWFEKYLETNTP